MKIAFWPISFHFHKDFYVYLCRKALKNQVLTHTHTHRGNRHVSIPGWLTNTRRDSNIFIHTDIIKALLLKRFILCYPLNPILRLKAITNKNPPVNREKKNNKRKKYARWANVQTLTVLALLLLFFSALPAGFCC